jgi:hypothetical protein
MVSAAQCLRARFHPPPGSVERSEGRHQSFYELIETQRFVPSLAAIRVRRSQSEGESIMCKRFLHEPSSRGIIQCRTNRCAGI